MRRDQMPAVITLAIVLLVGLALGAYGLMGGDEPPAATPTERPQYIPPKIVQPETLGGGDRVETGSFSVVLPKGATRIERSAVGNLDQLTFAIGPVTAAVIGQDSRPHEPLAQFASLYGQIKGRGSVKLAGKPAYIFDNRARNRYSVVIVGRRNQHDYIIQLLGPADARAYTRRLALRLASSLKPA